MLLKTISLASQTEVTQVLFNYYSDYAHRNAAASDAGQLRTGSACEPERQMRGLQCPVGGGG